MPTVDLSERDNKETLFVKEEVTNDAEVFGEVVVDMWMPLWICLQEEAHEAGEI